MHSRFMHTRSITSTVMGLVLYRKQGVVRVDHAFGGKYSCGPHFILKAGGGGGGPRFGWKVQLWTSFRTESRWWWGWTSLRVKSTVMDLVSYRKQGVVGVDLASGEKYFYVAIYFYIAIGTRRGVPSASLPYLPRPLCFAWNLASMPNATVGKCNGA